MLYIVIKDKNICFNKQRSNRRKKRGSTKRSMNSNRYSCNTEAADMQHHYQQQH